MYCTSCGSKENNHFEFCTNCGLKLSHGADKRTSKKSFSFLKIIKATLLIVGALTLIVLGFAFFSDSSDYSEDSTQTQTSKTDQYNQAEVVAPVVNIFCPSTIEGEEVSGGSGTIISEDGLILTNSHIIPQDIDNIYTDEIGCMVVLPDPDTGQANEFFVAQPVVFKDLSDRYDIAFMEITGAYFDEEEQSYAGTYPRTSPAFDDSSRCMDETVKLGESVRIYGYPSISGGYSLTITDGVVSSFPGEGLIVTSAKISHGNSGGLAVDSRGCMIGIPSLVSGDEYESLGVIISVDLIETFMDELSEKLDN